MTKRESECLRLIREFWTTWGFGPTTDELREGLGLASKSNIHRLVTALERDGWIERTPYAARSMRPVDQRERRVILSALDALRRGDTQAAMSALEAAA
jgi:SOS-response transcriptional repressor LexA